jgi:hypothetical protein
MLATLATILRWLILLPVLTAVVLLAIANDHTVTVHLNPFDTSDPVLRADLALYQLAFVVFVLGALIGALVAWRGQRKYRQRARHTSEEAAFWQARAERAEPSRTELQPAGFLPRPERG